MSGSTIGGLVGAGIGFLIGGPAGMRWGFTIGSMLGGIVDPEKIYGPRLSDAQQQTSQEGVPIPFGYGTFPCAGNVIWASGLTEHENEEGGKGGPKTITYSYTRSYAIGVCEGEAFIQKIKRNGKLVYDISPGTTIPGKSAKFLRHCTIYTGDEAQTVDPTIEAAVGVGNSGPMRGLCYIVMEDDDVTDSQGAIPQFEFVVQKCGAVSSLTDAMQMFVAGLESIDSVATVTRTGTWTSYPAEIPGNVSLRMVAANHDNCIAYAQTEAFYFSTDRGVNWTAATDQPNTATRQWRHMAFGPGVAMAVAAGTGADQLKSYITVSYDGGDHWTETQLTGIIGAQVIDYAQGVYVIACNGAGGSDNGIWTASSPTGPWTQRSTATGFSAIHFNGSHWLVVGDNGKTYSAGPTAGTWTFGSQPGTGAYSFTCLTGGPGYFVAGASDHYGIFRTTDLGVTWTSVFSGGTDHDSAAAGLGVVVMGDTTRMRFSEDNGLTWTNHAPPAHVNAIAYMGPSPTWYVVPDADGLYATEDGDLIADYAERNELSTCSVTVGEIVADLCERAGIDATEYDVTELTDTVAGYKCAREASAQAFIEPLMSGFFFDRGEWDKKLRFPKRGGASVATLTPDDLVANDDALIAWDRVQEVELLRKVNVMTIDPAADYNDGKQSAERRVATIEARAEATVEIPIVCDVDSAARIAEKRLKVAWAETAKARFAYPQEFSYLTPTDVITLTDRAGASHRLRLVSIGEESGVWSVDEAMKDRASTYDSTATGVENPNNPPIEDTVTGPTLFVPMNLPQLRSQDNTPGVYVGARGILDGWNGCAILLSTDGGVSYQTVLAVVNPTTMGNLTAAMDAGGSPDTASVHVFGTLESKTTAQVDAGGNYSALSPNTAPDYVATSTGNEIIAYEDATETAPGYYTLGTLTRGLLDTTAESHASGDWFVDLATVYFIPVSADFAGTVLYFKAVSFGLSADSVEPVTLLYEAVEYILDGGGA